MAEKYSWMQDGSGAAEAVRVSAAINDLHTLMAESDPQLRSALARIGVEWHGDTAQLLSSAIAESAAWSVQTTQTAQDVVGQLAADGEVFAATRQAIDQPADVGGYGLGDRVVDVLGGPFGAVSDHRKRAEEEAAKDEAANRALYAYEAHSHQTLAAIRTPEAPPTIVVGSSAAQRPTISERIEIGDLQQPGGHGGGGGTGGGGGGHGGGGGGGTDHDNGGHGGDDNDSDDGREPDLPPRPEPPEDELSDPVLPLPPDEPPDCPDTPESPSDLEMPDYQIPWSETPYQPRPPLEEPRPPLEQPDTQVPDRPSPEVDTAGYGPPGGGGMSRPDLPVAGAPGFTAGQGTGTPGSAGLFGTQVPIGGLGSSAPAAGGVPASQPPALNSPRATMGTAGLAGGAAPRGQAAEEVEDLEHTDQYAKPDDGFFGLDDLPAVAPPVLGERQGPWQ
ncbi:hypothetical protein [Actinoalloteichus hymeniacidonis]|uniref:hypothetical protein n=1 Tax=Actinoalloteichus hymeniacidonis TaxID=340345 RepID=UPI00161CA60C|nr:hypothetical protein [Actinoalloteichus hymeniacidonis]MBB5905723.1 putative membrane protein YgcG [Actinoalloteichus hymeniacidonis]